MLVCIETGTLRPDRVKANVHLWVVERRIEGKTNDAINNLHINMMGINELPVYLFFFLPSLDDLLTRQVLLFILMHRFFYIITNTLAHEDQFVKYQKNIIIVIEGTKKAVTLT